MAIKKIFIDTNIYTAFKHNEPEIINALRRAEFIALNPVVLAELYSGFKLGTKEKRNLTELQRFLDNRRVSVLPISDYTSRFYTEIYTVLRKKGKPIPTNDMWIAASAMEHGMVLKSYDSHFKHIEGLLVE